MATKSQKCCGAMGIFGIIFGAIFIGVYPYIYDAILRQQMIVEEGSTSYEMWKTLPIPMYMKVYFFNVTNSEDIENRVPGVKPKLVEVGPYVFKEGHRKENVTFNNNSTVSFYQVKTWNFLPELSSGSLDDEITTINVIAMAAAEYARFNPMVFYTNAINGFFHETNASLFMTHKVSNMTFDGIYDSLLEAVEDSPIIALPIPFDKFGWFYPRNESLDYDGWFSMHTGEEDFTLVGQISEWNYNETIREDIYTNECGMLNGSAGEFFPSYREKTYVDFFTPDLCRSIRFNYQEETDVIGVSAYKYVLDGDLVANSSKVPDNWCFNPKADINQNVPHGMLNVSSCKFNAPAFVSYPHFYQADEFYINQFQEGTFNPNKNDHESSLKLEPISGVPLEVKIRMQINMLVSSVNNTEDGVNYLSIDLLADMPPIFYPLIWFETYTELDDEIEGLLKLLGVAPHLGTYIGSAVLALGVLTSAIVIFFVLKARKRRIFVKINKYIYS